VLGQFNLEITVAAAPAARATWTAIACVPATGLARSADLRPIQAWRTQPSGQMGAYL